MTNYYITRSPLFLVLLVLSKDVSALSNYSKIYKETNKLPPSFDTRMNKENIYHDHLGKQDEFSNKIITQSKLLRRRIDEEVAEESFNNGEGYYSNHHEDSNIYYEEPSSSTSASSSMKDYQTDLTSTINNEYLPEGVYITQGEVIYIFAGILAVLAVLAAFLVSLFTRIPPRKDDDYLRSDLVREEFGVTL